MSPLSFSETQAKLFYYRLSSKTLKPIQTEYFLVWAYSNGPCVKVNSRPINNTWIRPNKLKEQSSLFLRIKKDNSSVCHCRKTVYLY